MPRQTKSSAGLFVALLLALLALAHGCTGGESHFGDTQKFLVACPTGPESCGDQNQCSCEVCTFPCAEPSDCRQPFESALSQTLYESVEAQFVCVAPSCDPEENKSQVCDVTCSQNTDCEFLEMSSNFRCDAGFCREFQATATIDRWASGTNLSCAISDEGMLSCFGDNSFGALGNSETSAEQGESSPLEGVAQVGIGDAHICALTQSDEVLCWGANQYGQAGLPAETAQVLEPQAVEIDGITPEQLHVGPFSSCVVSGEGALFCWGRSIGLPVISQELPAEVPDIEGTIKEIALGNNHSCVRTDDQGVPRLFCWGDNFAGQLGFTPSEDASGVVEVTNVPVPDEEQLLEGSLATSQGATCAIADAGRVFCWGSNTRGQLGVDAPELEQDPSPTEVVGLPARAVHLFGAWHHYCALLDNAQLACWGAHADIVNISWSAEVVASDVVHASLGNGVTFIEKSDGTLESWGPSADYLRRSGDPTEPAACCTDTN